MLPICFVLLVHICLNSGYAEGKGIDFEPKCSRFDYEEKLLEKMIRIEHKTDLMMESFREISTQVKADKDAMKTDFEAIKRRSEELESLQRMSIQTIAEELASFKQNSTQTIVEEVTSLRQKSAQTIAEIKEKARKPSYAFSAYWLSNKNPLSGDDLIFGRTMLDDENVYSNKTGKFTVPVDGIYVFFSTLCGSVGKNAWVTFLAGHKEIGKIITGDNSLTTCSTGSAIAKLQKSTEVFLQVISCPSGAFYQSETVARNSFSGHLLQPI